MSERLQRLAELGLVDLHDWQTDPPVQVTGHIAPEGHAFYLRLRSGGALLRIHAGDDRDAPMLWQGDADYVEGPDPCSFSADVVSSVAAELLSKWRSGEHPWPCWPPSS